MRKEGRKLASVFSSAEFPFKIKLKRRTVASKLWIGTWAEIGKCMFSSVSSQNRKEKRITQS